MRNEKEEFWRDRWKNNEIGFHQEKYNQEFRDYLPKLKLKPGDTIFFPLCGKSLDMILAVEKFQLNVIGVELSEIAVQSFFTHPFFKNPPTVEENSRINVKIYKANNIKIILGNLFTLPELYFDKVNAIYDRAALVALSPEERKSYYKFLNERITNVKSILLESLYYKIDDVTRCAPPYAVAVEEILKFYERGKITLLKHDSITDVSPKFKENNVLKIEKNIHLIEY